MESELLRESVNERETLRPRTAPATPRRVLGRGAIIGARWRFLAEAGTALDRSLEHTETLKSVVQLVVPRMVDYAAIADGTPRKRARNGAGLGLTIAKGIVDAHGGSVRVDNEPGGGSCFRFTLPVASR